MEAQQATFGTFNLAAEKVAENLEDNSPGVADIQDKMEEFNDRWNKITTEVSNRISVVWLRHVSPFHSLLSYIYSFSCI